MTNFVIADIASTGSIAIATALVVGFLGGPTSKFLLRLALIRTLLYSEDEDKRYTPLGAFILAVMASFAVVSIIALLPTELAAPLVLGGSALLLYRKYS